MLCLPLRLGGEVLRVRALGLIGDLVALALLGVPLLDRVHLGVAGVQLGVGGPVCAGERRAPRGPGPGVLLRLAAAAAAVSWEDAGGTVDSGPLRIQGPSPVTSQV